MAKLNINKSKNNGFEIDLRNTLHSGCVHANLGSNADFTFALRVHGDIYHFNFVNQKVKYVITRSVVYRSVRES